MGTGAHANAGRPRNVIRVRRNEYTILALAICEVIDGDYNTSVRSGRGTWPAAENESRPTIKNESHFLAFGKQWIINWFHH